MRHSNRQRTLPLIGEGKSHSSQPYSSLRYSKGTSQAESPTTKFKATGKFDVELGRANKHDLELTLVISKFIKTVSNFFDFVFDVA